MNEITPFELLDGIRKEAQALASQGLKEVAHTSVKTIAFRVNNKGWLRGLVNSKGVLYSVSDVSLFAGFGRPVQTNKGHLLLLNDDSQQSALLVNRVIGFRYFDDIETVVDIDSKQDVLDGLSAFVNQGFHAEGQDWYELNVSKLLESEQFREVQ